MTGTLSLVDTIVDADAMSRSNAQTGRPLEYARAGITAVNTYVQRCM